MNSVAVCSGCGKTIDRCFYFCPWCGLQQGDRTPFASLLDESCAKLEKVANENKTLQNRILKLEAQMDRLCSELLEIPPPDTDFL